MKIWEGEHLGEWTYESDDFLRTAPYEELYKLHNEPFVHAAKMEELATYALSKGFKGFKTMYKKYIESLKAQSDTIYIDNVTSFSGQPLELNAGDWEAGDDGIYKKAGFNNEVACPHPIMANGIPMQEALDQAYLKLQAKYPSQQYIWDLNAAKRWGRAPASDKQLKIISRRCKGFDTSSLTKMQASQILNRIMNGRKAS
jgi:hypothetical protein